MSNNPREAFLLSRSISHKGAQSNSGCLHRQAFNLWKNSIELFLENESSLRRPILVSKRLPSVGRPIDGAIGMTKGLASVRGPIRMASVGRPIGKRLAGGPKLRGGGNDRLGAD